MYDLIMKKRGGAPLADAEIKCMIDGYTKGEVADYQMAAMLMAIYFRGMSDHETAVMTECMARSGEVMDLSAIEGRKADKHSTGGVGDKTTLIVAPLVAACGGKVAKMSGRGLGHTGGTIDKLESIPGFRTQLSKEEFFSIVNEIGVSVIGQTGNLAPADKKIYALRDVTATVDSIPLIAASIMSKKLAAGSDCILLDVKTGSGAFMKSFADSVSLAEKMVAIGEKSGKRTVALITDMDTPLGFAIGNSLEVSEAADVLRGRGAKDLTEVSVELAANMLHMIEKGKLADCRAMARRAIADGSALKRLAAMVEAQGGDKNAVLKENGLDEARYSFSVKAEESGYIAHMDSEQCGIAAMLLGAGRAKKEDAIDYAAGIVMKKKTGDFVEKGDELAVFYAEKENLFLEAARVYRAAITLNREKPVQKRLILARISKDGCEKY
jgi:pyrimidine-nucleoside phosphorylase